MKRNRDPALVNPSDQHQSDRFITASELANRWAISESAVYHGKCGTAKLMRVRFGNSLRFLREEVERIDQQSISLSAPKCRYGYLKWADPTGKKQTNIFIANQRFGEAPDR